MGPRSRAQTDVDRVFYLVVGVVAFLVVVPAVAGVAGVDIRNASLPGGGTDQPEDDGLRLLSAYGTNINDDRSSVGVVEVVVTTGGSTVDLSEATVSWDGGEQYQITPDGVDVGTGSFGISGATVMNSSADRATLRFDLGTDDLARVDEFGSRLSPGDSITVSVSTPDGNRASRKLRVPDPLPAGAGVSLF